MTVTELIGRFWRHLKLTLVKNGHPTGTHLNYRPMLRLLRERFGRTDASDFGPLALKALRLAMIEAKHSRRYINESIHRIRKVFKWAASEQLISPLIFQALATVEGLRKGNSVAHDPEPVDPVADEVVDRTIPFMPKIVADMVRLQRLTGARPGEICGLRPCDVDRKDEVWKYIPSEHKTEHHNLRRVIYIGPKAQAILSPYLIRHEAAFCFSPAESERQRREERQQARKTPIKYGNRAGTNRKTNPQRCPGDQYINDSYRHAVQRACEVAFNMPEELRRISKKLSAEEITVLRRKRKEWRKQSYWTPHQLRHSAGTEIRKKYGLEAAQVTLGHNRIDVTEIYAEKNSDLAMQVAREVG